MRGSDGMTVFDPLPEKDALAQFDKTMKISILMIEIKSDQHSRYNHIIHIFLYQMDVIANLSLCQVIDQIIYVAPSIDLIRVLYPLSKQSSQILNNRSMLAYLHVKYDLYRRADSYSELIKLYHYQYLLEFPFYDSYYKNLIKAICDGDLVKAHDFLSRILKTGKMKTNDIYNLFYLAGRRQDVRLCELLGDIFWKRGVKIFAYRHTSIKEYHRGGACAGLADHLKFYMEHVPPRSCRLLDVSEEIGKSGNISCISMILKEYVGDNFKALFSLLKGVVISGNVENYNLVIEQIKNQYPGYDYNEKAGIIGGAVAQSGNIEMFKAVKSHNKTKYNLKRLVYRAALGGHLKMINHFLRKTPPNKKQKIISMIYFTACKYGHIHVLKQFEHYIYNTHIQANRMKSSSMDRYLSAAEKGLISTKFLELDSLNSLFYGLAIESRNYEGIKYLLSMKLDFRTGAEVLLLSPYDLDGFPSYDVNTGTGGRIVKLGESLIALLAYYLENNTDGILI